MSSHNPASTQRSADGPWKFSNILTSGTYKRPSEDTQGSNTKTNNFIKKLFFRRNSPCITYLFLLFAGRTNIQNFWTETSMGHLWDPVVGRLGDEMMRRTGDIRRTSVKHVFWFNSRQLTQDFIVNGGCKKISKQYNFAFSF